MAKGICLGVKSLGGEVGGNNKLIALRHDEVDNLMGRVLTLIEASVDAGGKLDALKSLIKQEIWSAFTYPHEGAAVLEVSYKKMTPPKVGEAEEEDPGVVTGMWNTVVPVNVAPNSYEEWEEEKNLTEKRIN